VFNLLQLRCVVLFGVVDALVVFFDGVDALGDLRHVLVDVGQVLGVSLLLLAQQGDLLVELLLLANQRFRLFNLVDLFDQSLLGLSGHCRGLQAPVQDFLAFV